MKHKINFGVIGGIILAALAIFMFITGFVGCAS